MILDACGVSCPEPLVMLKKAFQTETELVILVDSKSTLLNCEKYAKSNGFSVETEKENDIYKMRMKAKNE